MKTTMKFDRVILIKELGDKFRKVGEIYEIANIFDNAFLLRDANTKVAIGTIAFEDFEEYFVHEENYKGWTDWTSITGFDGQTDAYYRTNRKKTQVKFITDNVRAESFLNVKDGDEFNLYFGLNLAYLRTRDKALVKKKEKYEEELKNINEELKKINMELTDNERIIQKMINSLPN